MSRAMERQRRMRKIYPEMAAGGFSRDDHHVIFYSRVRALLSGRETVLDFGAGRGKVVEMLAHSGYKQRLVALGDTCRLLVGGDVDPVVAENPLVDRAVIWAPDGSLPFADDSFDLIVSWAVLEHVEMSETCARELERVLRPGGWICAWTPNRWGVAGLGGRLVPNAWHAWVLRRLVGDSRTEADVFPTRYRMNTRRRLRRLFPPERFEHATHPHSGPPAYVARSRLATLLARVYQACPGGLTATHLHVFMQKRGGDAPEEAPARRGARSTRVPRRRTVATTRSVRSSSAPR